MLDRPLPRIRPSRDSGRSVLPRLGALLAAAWIACATGAGCDAATAVPRDMIDEVRLRRSSAIPTVFHLEWSTRTETTGFVEYGLDGALDRTVVAAAEDTHHVVTLAGLRPSSSVTYRLTVIAGGRPVQRTRGRGETGDVPAELSPLTVEILDPDADLGGYLVGSLVGQHPAAVILDREGHYVWWQLPHYARPMVTATALGPDDRSLIYNRFDTVQDEEGQLAELVEVAIDGRSRVVTPTPWMHHDFALLPDGTRAYLAHDFGTVDGVEVRGDAVIEIAPDGTESTVWSAWDTLDPHGQEGDPEDGAAGWTHANALAYDAADDGYLVSLRNLSAVVAVGRDGVVRWQLGGEESDFAIVGTEPFEHQHQARPVEGGVLLFDNGPADALDSRVVELALDHDAGEAELRWSYEPDPPIYVATLGNAQRLPSGDTLIAWGLAGQVDQVTPSGEVVWRLNTALGSGLGYTTWINGLAP